MLRSFDCRHCLWVMGNAATLCSSASIWEELVRDAVDRRCYFNWDVGSTSVLTYGVPQCSTRLIGNEQGWNETEFASAFEMYLARCRNEARNEADICDVLGSLQLA